LTNSTSEETTQQSSPLLGMGTSNADTNTVVATNGDDTASTASLPAEILQLLQNQASLTQLTQSGSARNLAALQESETLGELVAGGTASEGALSNALATSKLRISMLMTFGQSLFQFGDRYHAEMFFGSIVMSHENKATVKQMARSYLWLGKLLQDNGLSFKYQQADLNSAAVKFDAAATDYLSAKDASQDWVRGSGWLGAAACYREMGDQVSRRVCLRGLLNDSAGQSGSSSSSTNGVDQQLGFVQRDMANFLLGNSYYEEGQYVVAAQVYSQMVVRISAQIATGSEEYSQQSSYLNLANASLTWCATQQLNQATVSGAIQNSSPTSRQLSQ
jgi:tetratricopeptide (TPR) repeat protein